MTQSSTTSSSSSKMTVEQNLNSRTQETAVENGQENRPQEQTKVHQPSSSSIEKI